MGQKITITDGPYVTFTEAVAGALDNKEDHLVALDNTGKLVLFTGSAPAIGVMVGKLQAGQSAVQVRLLGKGGTVRVIQNAAITPGARVMAVNANARVVTIGAAARSLGFKLTDSAGAAGDVIEIADVVEYAP